MKPLTRDTYSNLTAPPTLTLQSSRCYCMKSARIRSFSGPNAGKYGPEKLRMRRLFTQFIFQ